MFSLMMGALCPRGAEECFNRFGCLVIGYIEGWLVGFVLELLKYFLEGLHDGVIRDICDWNRKNVVSVIVVSYKIILVSIE